MEQYRPNIGETPHSDARRDAIHIAVVPLRANHLFEPGEVFSINSDGRAETVDQCVDGFVEVGIVDPFLRKNVEPGEMFWGFLFPNTITNLRHVWEHPAFKAAGRLPIGLQQ